MDGLRPDIMVVMVSTCNQARGDIHVHVVPDRPPKKSLALTVIIYGFAALGFCIGGALTLCLEIYYKLKGKVCGTERPS